VRKRCPVCHELQSRQTQLCSNCGARLKLPAANALEQTPNILRTPKFILLVVGALLVTALGLWAGTDINYLKYLPEQISASSSGTNSADDNSAESEPNNKTKKITVTGRVIGVIDGESFTLLDENDQSHIVNLEGVEAPEIGSEFDEAAKESLKSLILGRDVSVAVSDTDEYNRRVGTVYADGLNVNLEQVKIGETKWARNQTPASADINLDADAATPADVNSESAAAQKPRAADENEREIAAEQKSDETKNSADAATLKNEITAPAPTPYYFEITPAKPDAPKPAANNAAENRVNNSAAAEKIEPAAPPAAAAAPRRTPLGDSPVGATARCRDGVYSYSKTRSGTCSSHGGVAVWLVSPSPTP
jgi:endonuclease YncB( thermonuclease family)